MKMNDSRVIAAPVDRVWAALMDGAVLEASVPGCTELTGSPDDGFDATVVQKVGPVKATFRGSVTLSEMDAPNRLRIDGEGKGGAAGFARGGASVALTPVEGGTELSYDVDAAVGGKLAQLGSRIIDSFARKMADKFFERLQEEIEARG